MSGIHQPIKRVQGRGIVVRGNDIDTDQIIPARYMKVVTFDGLGEYAFYDVRYDGNGNEKPHPFNDPKFDGASILIVNSNFGCGSSREHAPQALMRSGIEAIIGESYAEIFAGNCTAMGVPAVKLSHEEVEEIMSTVDSDPSTEISIDLPKGVLTVGGREYSFDIPPAYLNALTAGTWDSTSVLLSSLSEIDQTMRSLPYLNNFAS
ncbi:MAG: 3-isopropylmalate dehydratase small subunit [Alkalispirochaetaceae bacterium]